MSVNMLKLTKVVDYELWPQILFNNWLEPDNCPIYFFFQLEEDIGEEEISGNLPPNNPVKSCSRTV